MALEISLLSSKSETFNLVRQPPPNVPSSLRPKQMVLNLVVSCPNHLPALGPGDKVLMVCHVIAVGENICIL